MCALGHAVAAVENRFVASRLGGLLCSHNAGQKVKRLYIAVEETGILKGNKLDFLICILYLRRLEGDPDIRRNALVGNA